MRALMLPAAVGLLAVCATSAAGAATPCRPPGAHLLASDPHAQVYALDNAVYGCDRNTHEATKLGVTTNCVAAARVDHLALAGDVVAHGVDRCGVDAGSTTVIVRRLSDGKQLRAYPAIRGPVGPESYESLGSLVVKPDGAVAWIATARSIVRASGGETIQVHANGMLLEAGPGIKPHSLRLHGSRLTWRWGSQLQHWATL
jgi:hypothetical protein